MILVQSLVDRMTSTLDAEGSSRYRFDQDFKPAINSAIDWIVLVFNAAFANKKLSEENLKELIKNSIWQANGFSRIYFDEVALGHKIWTILNISPEPSVFPVTVPPALVDNSKSVYRGDLTLTSSDHSAKRLTLEQWNENRKNIFTAGNETLSNDFKTYAYLNHQDYRSTGYLAGGSEVEVRPSISSQFVSLSYLKVPDEVTVIGDSVEFPETVFNLIYQKALNFIAHKQGDQTTLFAVTDRDVNQLIQLVI